jgi:hypothetical protein
VRSASINSTTFSRLKTHTRKIDISTDSVTPERLAAVSSQCDVRGIRRREPVTRSLAASHAARAQPRRRTDRGYRRSGVRAVAMPAPSSAAEVLPLLGCETDARSRGEGASRERARGWRVAVFAAGAHARTHDFKEDNNGRLDPNVRRRRRLSRRAHARRSPSCASWVLSDVSEISPDRPTSLDVLSSSRRPLLPDTRFLTVSSHAILTYQLRSRSCAPWVWRARRSARATSARSPRGSGARGTTARAHPSPVTARPAVATPRAPSARRTNRSSGRTTTLP